jgi:hypothetical protein
LVCSDCCANRHTPTTLTAVADPREERLAKNEAVFRVVNERMAEWEELHADRATELYACECADPDCRDKVALQKGEYEHVRSDSRWFAVAPGHVIPDVETAIETHDGWVLIEKTPEVTQLVQRLDERDAS